MADDTAGKTLSAKGRSSELGILEMHAFLGWQGLKLVNPEASGLRLPYSLLCPTRLPLGSALQPRWVASSAAQASVALWVTQAFCNYLVLRGQ